MTDWVKEQSVEKPEELQLIAPGLYMQRKDISKTTMPSTDDGETMQVYECLCRKITESEYSMLTAIEEIDNSKAIDAYTMQLIEEGVL